MLAWGVSPSLLKYFYAFSVSILIVHSQSWLEVHQMGKTWKVRPRSQEALMQWGQRRKLRNGDSGCFPKISERQHLKGEEGLWVGSSEAPQSWRGEGIIPPSCQKKKEAKQRCVLE